MSNVTRSVFAAALVVLPTIANAQAISPYDTFNFKRQRVDSAAIYGLTLADARLVRGILFGRNGRIFDDNADIKVYLKTRPWYKADKKFSNTRLNAIERANLDIIRGAEAAKHPTIQPGDLRYFADRPITVAMVGKHDYAEWLLLNTEFDAMHGRLFADTSVSSDDGDEQESLDLQKYYYERYWYHANGTFTAPPLNEQEKATMDTLALAQMLQSKREIAPGMMYLFQNTRLTPEVLAGVSIYDLRILRNEVYARRGRRFTTPWLKSRFEREAWYKPRADFTIAATRTHLQGSIAAVVLRQPVVVHT